MKHAKMIGLCLLATAVTVTGCSKPTGTSSPPPTISETSTAKDGGEKPAPHTHGNGPNGGVTFDLGKYHAEFTVDHAKKEVTILILKDLEGKKESEWPAEAVAANELTVSIKETKVAGDADKGKVVPPMTITLKPVGAKNGKASKFVGADPGIGNVADFEGTVLGEIDGKPSQGEFKE